MKREEKTYLGAKRLMLASTACVANISAYACINPSYCILHRLPTFIEAVRSDRSQHVA